MLDSLYAFAFQIMLPLALILPLAVAVEIASPKTRIAFKDRFPGALFLVLMPGIAFIFSWPLRQFWDFVGVEPLFSLRPLHPALQVVLLLIGIDLLRYWEHRFEHRFFWNVHAVHHSQRDLHASNSYSHPLNGVPEYVFVTAPMSFVSMDYTAFIVAVVITALQSLLIHSPLRVHFGPLRRVIVDSRFHRIHHSLEPAHFEKNFSIMFSGWDRLFGTAHHPAADEWPSVGIDGSEPPKSFRDYLLFPIRTSRLSRQTDAEKGS